MSVALDLQSNPLINPPALPHGAPAFDLIKPEHFIPAIDYGIAKAEAAIDAIKTDTALPTFENTIEALEFSDLDLDRISSIVGIYGGSKSSDEIRALEEQIDPKITAFSSNIFLDDALFARVDSVFKMRDTLNLTPEQNMLLDKTYKAFARNGAALDLQGKQRVREIDDRLATLATKFGGNTVKSRAAYTKILDQSQLAGLPGRLQNLLAAAAESENFSGQWIVKLTRAKEVIQYSPDRALREELYRADSSIAQTDPQFDNRPLVLEIVQLRYERANILGFDNHAEYTISNQMAGDAKTVEDFLQNNLKVYKPAAERELQEIRDFALQDGVSDLKPWDVGYYARILKEQKFSFKEEELRPYLKLENVLSGLFGHAEKLFNIEMRDSAGKYPVYDADVKVYEVFDRKDGALLGLFYADFYEREGAKSSGAWMNGMRNRGVVNGQDQIPIIFNNCNYPQSTPTQPTLLDIDDVITMFHEFGHGLHGLLAKGTYPSLTGTRVKRDWVELPSQLMENWAKEKEVLDTFAIHWQSGQTMPAQLLQKMIDANNFGAAMAGLRQTSFGLIDMRWHTTDPGTIKKFEDVEDAVAQIANLMPREGGCISPHFGHLFSGGYSAGYYSYKWAEVLDADTYAPFKQQGLYNSVLADRLRTSIYEPGGTRPPMDLFYQNMGRAPDQDAMFRREGLLPNAVVTQAPKPTLPSPTGP